MLIDYIKRLITPDMVSLWVPAGQNGARDLIRGNHGTAFGTHPNVPVISTFQPPNLLTDGGLNIWTSATDLTNWTENPLGTSTINREATEKVEGDYSCRLDVDASNSSAQFYQANISLTPSKRYKIGLRYMNSVAGKTCKFTLRATNQNVYLKDDGTWGGAGTWVALSNSTVWQKSELEFYAHADYSSYELYLNRLAGTSSSIYFDDVSIEGLKSSVINPSVGWVFGGDDDYIACGNDSSLVLTRWTLGLWIYRKVDNATWERLLMKSDTNLNDYWIQVSNTGKLHAGISDSNNTGHSTSMTEDVPLCEWLRGIATFDGTYIKIFVNGVLKKTSADFSAFTPRTSNAPFWMGRHQAGYNFNGYQALPFIANKAWSQAQVTNDYLNTKGMFAPRG